MEIIRMTGIDTIQLPEMKHLNSAAALLFRLSNLSLLNLKLTFQNFRIIKTQDFFWTPGLDSCMAVPEKLSTGTSPEWLVRIYNNIILAGGLGPSNLEDALRSVQPYGVDINSGV
jgi:phosphoribosylanthranilate isomerase